VIAPHTANELMTVTAARLLKNEDVCFVGIGLPSAACNLARLTHAPRITLIYESGTIGARPDSLPLSIGDGELCTTAVTTVSVPEIFRYWLQGGRISVGFLGAAQIDRFGNLNTTVIGPYHKPTVRLPGAGGAAEMALGCEEIFIIMPHSKRGLVDRLDFITTLGHGDGGGDYRARRGIRTRGPTKVITELCILEPEVGTNELVVTSLHPGISVDHVREATGWPLRSAPDVATTPVPTAQELTVLRGLQQRTADAHGAA
jgi:glutaconate CoA-transferase, subunit B